jgi:hypothetical protein
LNETDEKKAMQALLLKNPLEEAANASDREINATRKTVVDLTAIDTCLRTPFHEERTP